MNGGHGGIPELHKVYKTLKTCSNTRVLHLQLAQGGCVLNLDDRWNFDFQPGDTFPALHELRLDGYDFNEYLSEWQEEEAWDFWYDVRLIVANVLRLEALRPLPRIGWQPFPGANLRKWKTAMDWTELRDLELEDVSSVFLDYMRGGLPRLESLRLGPLRWESCQNDEVTDFVKTLHPLSRLSLLGYTRGVNWTQILDLHGRTLKTLEVREWEGNYGSEQRPTLSLQQLEQISQICPFLSKLGIDINRNGTWPFEILDSLATNERLTSLELFFELGMDQHQDDNYSYHYRKTTDYRQPYLNASSSLALFKRLRSLKKGDELQQLTLHLGDVGRDSGHMLRQPAWGEEMAETYECSVVDSGGQRKEEGIAWCTEEPRTLDRYSGFVDEEDHGLDWELEAITREEEEEEDGGQSDL